MPKPVSPHAPSNSSPFTRREFLRAGMASLLITNQVKALSATAIQNAFAQKLHNTRAVAEIIDQDTGTSLLHAVNTQTVNTPGSILKPLILCDALKRGIIPASAITFCTRSLQIAGKPYPCTHPQSNIAFNAQEALTYSCNTWFASLALRMRPEQLVEILHSYQLHPSGNLASPADLQLLTLGLNGILTSPHQVASAYSLLAPQLQQPFARPVADGLRDSVSFGMAHNAAVQGLAISGKTGTANHLPCEPWSHGWFAGYATLADTSLTLCIYLPQGNGADAAFLAQQALAAAQKANA